MAAGKAMDFRWLQRTIAEEWAVQSNSISRHNRIAINGMSKCQTFQKGTATHMSNPDYFLRLPAVLERTGLSRSTLYRKIDEGTFPRQVHIAARCAAWRESAIDEWMVNPMIYSAQDQQHP